MMKKLISLLFTFLFSMVLFSSYGIGINKFSGVFESKSDATILLSSDTELSEIDEAIPIISTIQQPKNNTVEDNIVSDLEIDFSNEISPPTTKLEPEEILDKEPTMRPSNNKQLNRNTIIAIVLIPILFLLGCLAAYLIIFNGSLILGFLLLLVIGTGCIISLLKSIVGAKEIKDNRETQKGLLLSFYAAIYSIVGIVMTAFLSYITLFEL